ncbi:MAG: hypothetical protein J3R72DRAFT_171752 [Linnemannia gamsii]|nr:MAG: hypothetical protein J3R72DRAFT_171752 [Linnemannia gamsii]
MSFEIKQEKKDHWHVRIIIHLSLSLSCCRFNLNSQSSIPSPLHHTATTTRFPKHAATPPIRLMPDECSKMQVPYPNKRTQVNREERSIDIHTIPKMKNKAKTIDSKPKAAIQPTNQTSSQNAKWTLVLFFFFPACVWAKRSKSTTQLTNTPCCPPLPSSPSCPV